jgi:type VI secretion system FHA domain protein
MILTLSIKNPEAAGGAQNEFKLARRDALIGRSKACDWSLPDDKNYISTRHCQISFRDNAYYLKDISTNGTLLNGATERMTAERKIEPGDVFQIGQYQVAAAFAEGEEETAVEAAGAQVAKADAAPAFAASTSTWSRGADGTVSASEAAAPVAPPPPPPLRSPTRARTAPASSSQAKAATRTRRSLPRLSPSSSARTISIGRAAALALPRPQRRPPIPMIPSAPS